MYIRLLTLKKLPSTHFKKIFHKLCGDRLDMTLPYKTLLNDNHHNLEFLLHQNDCSNDNKSTVLWNDLFDSIRDLWDKDDNRSNSEELTRHLETLSDFLIYREKPPNEIIDKLCLSGLLVDIFQSLKSDGYRDIALNIICQIMSHYPDSINVFLQRDLSEAIHRFFCSTSTTPKMKAFAPFYIVKYLQCIAKSENVLTKVDFFSFFFNINATNNNYFMLIFQIIDNIFQQEQEDSIYQDIIYQTEIKIYSILSYLAIHLERTLTENENAKNSQNNANFVNNSRSNSNNLNKIQQIFELYEHAFEINREHAFTKLSKCLLRIWQRTTKLQSFFFSQSIILPLCKVINNQNPESAQLDTLNILSEIYDVFNEFSSSLNGESLAEIADKAYGKMICNNQYEKTTSYAFIVLGKKMLVDNTIPENIDVKMLISLCGILLSGSQYDSKNAAAFLVYVFLEIAGISLFITHDLLSVIEDALDVAMSGSPLIIGHCIKVTELIFSWLDINDKNNEYGSLRELLNNNTYQLKESFGEYSDHLDHIFEKYIKEYF
ncbi:hypothetical protein TRFO_00894 [Tritrichomonas foetus]|uniref:Uncharacterized protein n=1 Tax=Tritrichomonas foetus TaxID=1144522 RepID=A0A1J4L2I3_9EUKA|nr:hypothetical protein TRFO_00894 [Tritrichomonas foetus]|eukprot:OHT17626.1 hypothetical protein TRFO_00894 [Tritrichomonas foetus]